MNELFSFPLPEQVTDAIGALEASGFEAYAVGGCVRDLCRGETPHDYDITTSATPVEIESCFHDCRVIETGIKHGTVTVIVGGMPLEITTYRTDGVYLDGRHPESVTFSRDLSDDLSRRDFTMNAMAYSPTRGLCDPFGGRGHIRDGVVACVGEPDRRFGEDGLRILRALRFASVLGFSIAPETSASVHRCRALLKNISAERILSEFKRLIVGVGARAILSDYADIFKTVMPELESIDYDRAVGSVAASCADVNLRFALLLRSPDNLPALVRLKPDGKTLASVRRVLSAMSEPFPTDRVSLRRFLRSCPYDDAYRAVEARRAEGLLPDGDADTLRDTLREMESSRECVSVNMLAVSGSDLISLGLPPGKQLGQILDSLLESVVTDRLPNTRDALLSEVRREIWG